MLKLSNIISVITVMLVSMATYFAITTGLKNNKTNLMLIALGLKFLFFLAYLFIMILFFEISNLKMFVFTFMLIYFIGAIQLVYLLKKKLMAK